MCSTCDIYVLVDPEYELLLSEVVLYIMVPADMDSDSTLADAVLPCVTSSCCTVLQPCDSFLAYTAYMRLKMALWAVLP